MTVQPVPDRLAGALSILGPDETDVIRELDALVTGWGLARGAREILPPPVYPVADLDKLGAYANFPHLALVAAPLDVRHGPVLPDDGHFAPDQLGETTLGLPHATCFGAYLYHEGAELPGDVLVTLVNRCFRHEDHFTPLRRMVSFQMREIVALGTQEHARRLLDEFTGRITALGDALGLGLECVPAADPFFDGDGSRALLARLSPVKHEFQAGDLAIASVNSHRNFFGERCRIHLPGGDEPVHTSCVAFGLERWLSVLLDRFGGAREALAAVRDVRGRVC